MYSLYKGPWIVIKTPLVLASRYTEPWHTRWAVYVRITNGHARRATHLTKRETFWVIQCLEGPALSYKRDKSIICAKLWKHKKCTLAKKKKKKKKFTRKSFCLTSCFIAGFKMNMKLFSYAWELKLLAIRALARQHNTFSEHILVQQSVKGLFGIKDWSNQMQCKKRSLWHIPAMMVQTSLLFSVIFFTAYRISEYMLTNWECE